MTRIPLSSRWVCCDDTMLGAAGYSDASGIIRMSAVFLSGQVGGGDDDASLLRASRVTRHARRVDAEDFVTMTTQLGGSTKGLGLVFAKEDSRHQYSAPSRS